MSSGNDSSAPAEASEDGAIYILGANGEAVKIETKDLVIFDGEKYVSGNELDWSGFGESSSSSSADAKPSDILTFHGRGNGHGVGMSQSGIKVMAQQGFTFDEILKFYFTGITVENK